MLTGEVSACLVRLLDATGSCSRDLRLRVMGMLLLFVGNDLCLLRQ